MSVSFEDGIKYIECDKASCGKEIRENPVGSGGKVYHAACAT